MHRNNILTNQTPMLVLWPLIESVKFLSKTCMLHTCTRSERASLLHLTGNLWAEGPHLQCKEAASSRPRILASVLRPSDKKNNNMALCFNTFSKKESKAPSVNNPNTHLTIFGRNRFTGISVLETINAGLKFLSD